LRRERPVARLLESPVAESLMILVFSLLLEDHSSVNLDTTLNLGWRKRVKEQYLLWKYSDFVEVVEMRLVLHEDRRYRSVALL
jgi:hypothetical protein